LSSRVNFRGSSREWASGELGMALAPVTLLFIGKLPHAWIQITGTSRAINMSTAEQKPTGGAD
jgi:hypothetical protein